MADFNFTSISNMGNNDAYKTSVRDKAKKLMGGEKSITADKAFSIFKGYNKNLSPEMADKIQKIAAMDGDSNVSLSEMSAIYALFDMELGSDNKFHFDDKIGSNDAKFGIKEATDKEVQSVVNAFKTDEELAAEQKKAQEQKLKTENLARKKTKEIVGDYNEVNRNDYANMTEFLDDGVVWDTSKLKEWLEERGIDFTENGQNMRSPSYELTYEFNNKKYKVSAVENEDDGRVYFQKTDVYDASGNLVQSAYKSGIRDNTYGCHIINYNDGKPVLALDYDLKGENLTGADVYTYDKNNQCRVVSSYNTYVYVTDYDTNGEQTKEYRMQNGILFYQDINGEVTRYKTEDLANAE